MSENNMGWICPKCGAVHAPSVKRCDCVPTTFPCRPPKETTGPTIFFKHECTDPYRRPPFAPHYNFMDRPRLVTYGCGDPAQADPVL